MEKENTDFRAEVRATGLGEIWTHNREDFKFKQFGWRDTTKESSYSNDCLLGNWNEQRFDIKLQKKERPLPSQYAHYYENTYGTSYNVIPPKVPDVVKHPPEHTARSFPGHQPELDLPPLQQIYNSWSTTSRLAYQDPHSILGPQPTAPQAEANQG